MELNKSNIEEWKKSVNIIFKEHGWEDFLKQCGLTNDEVLDMAEGMTPNDYFLDEVNSAR